MTPERREAWRPQEPSPDFADRTVAALLRERTRVQPRASKRWMAGVVMAAVLVSGAAFGLTGMVRHPRPAAPPPPVPIGVEVSHDVCVTAAPPAERTEAPPAPTQDVPRRAPRRALPPNADAGAGTPAGVKFPRCDCSVDQVLCTCF
jgi:hypothetical protein